MVASLGFNRGPKARTISLPAPIGGWNTRDALDLMPPQDAIQMDNWFPDVDGVKRIKGYSEHADTVGSGAVESVMSFQPAGTGKLLAASATNIYDVTSTGTATSIVGSLSGGRWDYCNMNGHILLGNGADHAKKYDGTTFQNVSTGSTSGLTFSNCTSPFVFKSRIFWIEQDTQSFWYGAADAIDGTLNEFNLGYVTELGGKLIKGVTWSRDGGDGPDDYVVFITDSGEVLVYTGTNPGFAADFALVGVYRIGSPLSARSIIKYQDDVVLITRDDYVFLSEVIKNDGVITNKSKLVGALKSNLATASTFGWQAIHYPAGNRLVFNVPQSNGTFVQHGVNTITQAAFRQLGFNAYSWVVHNNNLYFGGADGYVYQAENTLAQDGVAINATCQTAFSDLSMQGVKRVAGVRTSMRAEGILSNEVDVIADYEQGNALSPTTSSASGTPWSSPWGSSWGPSANIVQPWEFNSEIGHRFSVKVANQSSGQNITWFRTDYRVEAGVGL